MVARDIPRARAALRGGSIWVSLRRGDGAALRWQLVGAEEGGGAKRTRLPDRVASACIQVFGVPASVTSHCVPAVVSAEPVHGGVSIRSGQWDALAGVEPRVLFRRQPDRDD